MAPSKPPPREAPTPRKAPPESGESANITTEELEDIEERSRFMTCGAVGVAAVLADGARARLAPGTPGLMRRAAWRSLQIYRAVSHPFRAAAPLMVSDPPGLTP